MVYQTLEKRDKCPACYCRGFEKVYSQSYSMPEMVSYLKDFYSSQGAIELSSLMDHEFEVNVCRECNVIFQTYVPGENYVFEIYEKWLEPEKTFELFERQRPNEYFTNLIREIYRFANLFEKPRNQLKFYDFGMGWGNWLVAAKALGCQVYGFDISLARTAHALRNGIIEVKPTDLADWQFDFINVDQVLEHVRDPLAVLKQLVSALSPSGVIRVAVPNGSKILDLLKQPDWKAPKDSPLTLNPIAPIEHINCFTTDSLVSIIKRANLEPFLTPSFPSLVEVSNCPDLELKAGDIVKNFRRALKNQLRPLYRKIFPARELSTQFQGTDLLCRLKAFT